MKHALSVKGRSCIATVAVAVSNLLLLSGFIGLALTTIAAQTASAVPVTFRAEGRIAGTLANGNSTTPLPTGLEIGAPLSVLWTFDFVPGTIAEASAQVLGVEIVLGNDDVRLSTSEYEIAVEDDAFVSIGGTLRGPQDSYRLRACSGGAPACSSPSVPDAVWRASLDLQDTTGAVLENAILGSSPDQLNRFLTKSLTVSFLSPTGTGVGSVFGDLDAIVLIPEPSTGLLLGLGLFGLGRGAKRSRRS